ncbi:glutamate racemase [Tenacibaculum maritimum]|uniref:Glutamate racemase n=1 Tax=Tenacibaculum maritimum NCIMB 2154 TaxID=1349785 RepID=A0A2H1ECD8_9FLAO|nr:glutamate racemase [Tenacibaculum maritimum]SFZ84281.1 Glutamate racemase [Tenacibaculum maritimum NCIMB 2154]
MQLPNKTNPIGIFDSGIGGTSIWKEIHLLLPHENTIYLSDSKNAPYGQKTKEEIIRLSIKNTEFLLAHKCKVIVVACNTATTNAIDYLRTNYKVPFIGIEPAIKPASLQTNTNTIGILATKGTLNSKLFAKTSSSINNNITIIEQVGEGLVELIEKGKINSKEMVSLLNKYIVPMLNANIDCLVLGCTHYPYLIPQIKKVVDGKSIHIIDSGRAVASQVKNILEINQLLSNNTSSPMLSFFTNKDKDVLSYFIKQYSNTIIKEVYF